jgi:hypothetical protein
MIIRRLLLVRAVALISWFAADLVTVVDASVVSDLALSASILILHALRRVSAQSRGSFVVI